MGDAIEFSLEGYAVGLFLIECEFSSMGVTSETAHIKFDVLSRKFLLVGLELQELFTVDHCTSASASTSACSTWGSQKDS